MKYIKIMTCKEGPNTRLIENILMEFKENYNIKFKTNKSNIINIIKLIKLTIIDNPSSELLVNDKIIDKSIIYNIENFSILLNNLENDLISIDLNLNKDDWENEKCYLTIKYIENESFDKLQERIFNETKDWDNLI